MIVCALPRCGATKICQDLALKANLRFTGELNPMYIEGIDNTKAPSHETSFQPNYTLEEYAYLIHNQNSIVLINQSPHLMIDRADLVILRYSLRDTLLSTANFFIKSRPYLQGEGIIQHLHLTAYSYIGIMAYLKYHSKKTIWYEEYFNRSGTSTDFLERHAQRKNIMMSINKLVKKCNNLINDM